MYVLEVMSGPLDGTAWRFEQEITIGRDESAAVACIKIDRYLSRSHALLRIEGNDVLLVDLSSRNGTTLDGTAVDHVPLPLGKNFTCGRTVMRVLEARERPMSFHAFPTLSHVSTIAELRSCTLPRPIGFVPTMGALHEGHLTLVERAQAECASVVVSIFVNPLQFGPSEDYDLYPRDLKKDLALLAERGINILFTPEVAEIYPDGFATEIQVGDLATCFEGAARPAHFNGVATVVTKLLNIVEPTRLYLGQKDAQQVAVLSQVIRDLDLPVEVVVVPTVRETDGLARSSRNVYLTDEERRFAPLLYRALVATAVAFREGATPQEACACGRALLAKELKGVTLELNLEYLEIVDARSFASVTHDRKGPTEALAIGVLRVRGLRLLDNVPIGNV